MNTSIADCNLVAASIDAFANGSLGADEFAAIDGHLLTCKACRNSVKRYRAVKGALEYVEQQERRAEHALALPANADAMLAPLPWQERLGRSPWWFVSLALHVLVIMLASLVTMAIELPRSDDGIIMVTELSARPDVKSDEADKPKNSESALDSKLETPPTDPTSKEASDIVVPPDIIAKADLGDHFETINPDKPDTHSAFGSEESRSFHSVSGSADKAGGGGTGGVGMEDVIGIGGAATKGTGGGFGGGDGSGIGVGKGGGTGTFGNRTGGGRKLMVARHGGSKQTEGAVEKALEWLAYHQEPDGHWDCHKWEGQDAMGRTDGIQGNAACTGFALLAFLGAGHTDRIGKYKDNVARGLKWLIDNLDAKGRWCPLNYTQGIAAMALAEAAGMNPKNKELHEAAQRAADGVTAGQVKVHDSEYNAWWYTPLGGTNDTSVSGWNVMALKSAKVAGLHVDPFSFVGAMAWINTGQDLKDAPKGGDAEYWDGGMMAYQGTVGQAPGSHKNMAMTAAAALTRLLVGGEKPDSAGIAGPCNLMKQEKNLPNKWPGNLYYWYYATLCMFQKGGDHWKAWNEPMKKTLVECQRNDGDFAGSYDPLDGEDMGHIRGGRVQATALGALCLEVYYRYQKLNP